MAKIILQNTRTHDITIHLAGPGGANQAAAATGLISSVKIPAAKQNPEDREKIVFGKAEADGDLIAAARRKSPVVEHYFAQGWLTETNVNGTPVNAGTAKKG
jgi:hypothetical protein